MTNCLAAQEVCQRRTDFLILMVFVLLLTLPFWIHFRNLPDIGIFNITESAGRFF
jgi:hypothetical protein